MRIRSTNPVYKYADYATGSDTATYGGVTSKIGILLGVIALMALTIGSRFSADISVSTLIVGAVVAPILAIISIIVVHRSPALAMPFSIVYAMCEGAFLGLISAIYAAYFGDAIVYTALLATFGVLAMMLFLYSSGIIRVGAFFRRLMTTMLFGLIGASLLIFIVAMAGGLSGGFYSF